MEVDKIIESISRGRTDYIFELFMPDLKTRLKRGQ